MHLAGYHENSQSKENWIKEVWSIYNPASLEMINKHIMRSLQAPHVYALKTAKHHIRDQVMLCNLKSLWLFYKLLLRLTN